MQFPYATVGGLVTAIHMHALLGTFDPQTMSEFQVGNLICAYMPLWVLHKGYQLSVPAKVRPDEDLKIVLFGPLHTADRILEFFFSIALQPR